MPLTPSKGSSIHNNSPNILHMHIFQSCIVQVSTLHTFIQSPTLPHSVIHFDKAYYAPLSPYTCEPFMSTIFSNHNYQNFIFACNLHHGYINKSLTKIMVNSGVSYHMNNALHLFISMQVYTGIIPYVTLGDDCTQCSIIGIKKVELFIDSGHKIRIHNMIYVPALSVSFFSIKQHMKYVGCSEHFKNNKCTIVSHT